MTQAPLRGGIEPRPTGAARSARIAWKTRAFTVPSGSKAYVLFCMLNASCRRDAYLE